MSTVIITTYLSVETGLHYHTPPPPTSQGGSSCRRACLSEAWEAASQQAWRETVSEAELVTRLGVGMQVGTGKPQFQGGETKQEEGGTGLQGPEQGAVCSEKESVLQIRYLQGEC